MDTTLLQTSCFPVMPGWRAWLAALSLAASGWATAAAPQSEPRHALVVGNASYATAPLINSVNDATAVAKVLEKAGFTVEIGRAHV